jgi:hypothetical protein
VVPGRATPPRIQLRTFQCRDAPPDVPAIEWRVLKTYVREFVRMAKKKFTSRQAGRQSCLHRRTTAEELKLEAASLSHEADDLFARAKQIEAARKR